MSFRYEKDTKDLVFYGFEKGIAPSPHKGIANIQNANIATETNEILTSYGRIQQSQSGTTATSHEIDPNDSNHLSTSFALLNGSWINVSASTISGLSTGTYYIQNSNGSGTGGAASTFQISSYYNGSLITGFGATGTATFTLLRSMGQPVAKAIEPYFSTSQQYRYYILDNQGLVWVYDTARVDAGVTGKIYWFLPDSSITYFGSDTAPSGVGVLNGNLFVFSGNKIWTKQTVNLGGTTSATTLWTQMTNALLMSKSTTTNPHFAFVGHQGKLYYTDGNYIGSIFPDTSLLTSVANIQSYAKYTSSAGVGTISTLIGGSIPSTGANIGETGFSRIPAVFFTDQAGTRPTNLSANVIYYIAYSTANENFEVYDTLDGDDTLVATTSFLMGATSGTLSSAFTGITGSYSTTFSNDDVRTVSYTYGSTSISWTGGLSDAATDTITITGGFPINITAGASGNQYFNTFWVIGTHAGAYGDTSITTFTPQRVNLPFSEVSKTMTEIGNNIVIGALSNTVYPWNQIDATPSGLIFLPESNSQTMITVNQMAYIFAGNKGNIYITDGSVASLVIKVPDYCAGVPGSPSTYIEPYFSWGDAMYLRGRVYFSILDQTSSKAGNCGGIWSFIPTQNLYIGQDVGLALRLENQNSYATYNGLTTILIPFYNQAVLSPQYWSAWYSDVTSATYGVDFTDVQPDTVAIVETDLVPTGTILGEQEKTYSNIEFKLASPLLSGESVTINYRQNGTDAWASAGTINYESSKLSGYISPMSFQVGQWLQLQIKLTPNGGGTFSGNRLLEVRLRQT